MIATQDSVLRDTYARTLEAARSKLRETIDQHPDASPANTDAWRRGYFAGILWIVTNEDPSWRDQAIRYSKALAGIDGDGLGFALLPSVCRWAEATHDPDAENAVARAAHGIVSRLGHQEPIVSSLMDAILLFHASAISGNAEMRAAAASHCLAARRLLVRGDGSLSGNSSTTRDLAFAIFGFGEAYRFTRDPRFLGTAENCAACLLDTLHSESVPEDDAATAIASSALVRLSSLAADPAKVRFYALSARQLLIALENRFPADDAAQYFLLDALSHSAPSMNVLAQEAPRNGVVHPPEAPPEVIAEPEPQTEPEPEPEPRGARVHPWIFLFSPIIFFLLVDALVFRSNYYTRFIEPESSEGTFESVFQHEKERVIEGDKAVIVLGSSRIAEGFSAKRVNLLEPKGGYFFINGAVSGAGPRCMYYMVRDLDPNRNRYKALVMTIDDYTDPDDYEDLADRLEDLHSVIARLRLSDVFPFTQSFTTRKTKWAVLSGSLLEAIVYQRDVQEFLDHPSHRIEKAKLYRAARADWYYDYGGSDHSIAGTTIDWATKTITFPPNIPQPEQDYLRPRLIPTAPQKDHHVRDFQVRWLGALADLYRNSKTRIIFIQPPRTPLPKPTPLAHWPWTTVDDLAKRPWVKIVDRTTFENLERPELFSDYAHLNKEGQKLFSPALAATVKSILEPQAAAAKPAPAANREGK